MAEQVKQVLDLFTHPAFLVKDGVVLLCNSAADPLLPKGTALSSIMEDNETLLSLWNRKGTAQISIILQGVAHEASVRVYEDMLLFVAQVKNAEYQSSAAAILNASVSLRKPLHNLMSSASELFDRLEDEESRDSAAEVNRALYQLMRLCGQMSDGGRLLLNQLKAHRVPTDLQSFFDRFICQIRPLVESAGRNLSYTPVSAPVKADVDTDLLERALLNLVSNALSYTPKGGVISLQIQKKGKRLLISLSDNGEGICPEVLGNLFDRRTDRPFGDSRWGLGYGLQMVRKIARLHNGTMM
ncbi:MAG: HAMP domain-containing histidine kinase, partial [Oscillospiraceae bacterium]|nr:HAMP domain-containing histidine kinase [Oscillospiraceae bacterium]